MSTQNIYTRSASKRTNNQNTKLHALLSKLKIDKEMKESLVNQFTNGREISSANMTKFECKLLIEYLQKYFNQDEAEKCDKMRRRILSLCHEMGWELENGKVDMERVNGFCLNKGYLAKPLNNYNLKELPKLIYQFEKVYEHYLKNL
jgi:hypothetical protein